MAPNERSLVHELFRLLVEADSDGPVAVGIAPVDSASANSAPVDTAPTEPAPVGAAPVDTPGAGIAPVDSAPAAGELELSVRPLDPTNPLADVLGFTAPSHWVGFGIIAEATPERTWHPSTIGHRRVGAIVTRDGDAVAVLERPLDASIAAGEPSGLLVDICRRALGLRTDAPETTSLKLFARRWLGDVLAVANTHPDPAVGMAFADAAHAGPLSRLVAELVPELAGADPHTMLALGVPEVAHRWPWAILRRMCADAALYLPGLDAFEAAWMDDGVFCRWVLASLPPSGPTLDDLEHLLDPDVFDDVLEIFADLHEAADHDAAADAA